MALSIVAGTSAVGVGGTTTVARSVTPVLPTGSASGDRVFVFTTSANTVAAPTSWNTVATATLGSGTTGAGTGTRIGNLFYRDYDGAWTMPAFTSASGVSSNNICGSALTMRPGAGETLDAPTFTSGSDTTSGTGFSVAGSSLAIPTAAGVLCAQIMPSFTTTASSAQSLTAAGVTFGTLTTSCPITGNASGNSVGTEGVTCLVTAGATAAPTFAETLGIAETGGTIFLFQTSSTPPLIIAERIPTNQARFRASLW